MKYYIYKYQDDDGREGLMLLTETEKDIILAQIKKHYRNGGDVSNNDGEDTYYDDLDDLMNCITFEELNQHEYLTLKKVIGVSFGETGPAAPLDEDEDEDEEYCDNCGSLLLSHEDDCCESCKEEEHDEEDYNDEAKTIVEFIEKEYSLVKSSSYGSFAKYNWKPTIKTQIEIEIPEFSDGDEEVELTLKLGNKAVDYEYLSVENSAADLSQIRSVIKNFIEKAKKY